jgi:YHS domain-containing protein
MTRAAALALLSAASLSLLAAGCAAPKEAAPASPTGAPPKEAEKESARPAGGGGGEEEVMFVPLSKDYPLKTCVVSGEDLMEDGHPVAIVYQGIEVQFCCKDCVAKFTKNPAPYLAKLKAATPPK